MYQNLKSPEDKESVHLCSYPVANKAWKNEELRHWMFSLIGGD